MQLSRPDPLEPPPGFRGLGTDGHGNEVFIEACSYVGPYSEHGGELLTIERGCEHEHVGEERCCVWHWNQFREGFEQAQPVRCTECGHQCRMVVRAKETGEEFRLNVPEPHARQ